jgi:short-subunit dehydrogenase
MLKSGSGHISLVASVAGYMGLPKSLIYGPTKAALINMAESLYLDVHERGIGVSVINPGFVDTPLTKGNDFKMPSLITPETAAGEIIRGFEKGLFEIHFPKKFTAWLRLIRRLPYSLRFRLLSKVST